MNITIEYNYRRDYNYRILLHKAAWDDITINRQKNISSTANKVKKLETHYTNATWESNPRDKNQNTA